MKIIIGPVLLLCMSVQSTTSQIYSHNMNDPRIVGGTPAEIIDAKHQASIRLRFKDILFGEGHICGGALISPTTVLTAAHCGFNIDEVTGNAYPRGISEFVIILGALNRYVRTPHTLQFLINQFIFHEKFNPRTMQHDIALMVLHGSVPPDHITVKPIALVYRRLPEDTDCKIVGWGTIGYLGSTPVKLLVAPVKILSTQQCSVQYGNAILEGMMCAGDWNGRSDACQGDSGGPLTCDNMLAGIISWGNKCGQPNFPGIYSDVFYYHDWIKANKSNVAFSCNKFVMLALILSNLFLKLLY